ncbi:hypothetical protein EYB53_010980 [Candidatus Chloroploca sp. M-50]|uniref:Uncharacterized protein n=1 Tax=Candidatus Chloroploca mongolica TaxID=2528176 RepID=A0ABS4D9W1_9CHLR|nr:hypothetical protein [Candidatus Chloroploca mongolica]MBP1466229.1 hypothetical protein [Candidatus Chloroploca mongolica]
MSLSGARGLIRVAHNPTCELQAAMMLTRVREQDVYLALAGTAYPGEYGERVSARRRGAQFEKNLYQDGAAVLRGTLAPLLGVAADDLTVRDLSEEVRGSSTAAMEERAWRTDRILMDLAADRIVPDLLIQPQLQLTLVGNLASAIFIAPDVLALDRQRHVYLPVEIKSFIVRDGVVAQGDRDGARRQAAIQLLALAQELIPLGIADRLPEAAIFIFASPFGMRPHPAFAEQLSAELFEMRRVLDTMAQVRTRLQALGATAIADAEALALVAPRLATTYQESCVAGCLLAQICRQHAAAQPTILGDRAAQTLGETIDLPRALALLHGAPATDEREAWLGPALREAAALFDWSTVVQGRAA